MKKKKADGTFYYYYYKKKVGRKKKTGPKKKKGKRGYKYYDGTWHFKIIKFDFRKQVEYIGQYRKLTDVEKKKRELLEENNNIEFPVRHVNNRRKNDGITELISEYVILKKIENENDSNESMVRNEYGKLIKHVTTSGNYYVYDKFKCLTEETFWVYGLNPKDDRKTVKWIRENIVDKNIEDPYNIVNIFIYNNKVIFRYTHEEFDFVICKNKSDAIYMYNILSEKYKGNRQVIFTGLVSGKTDRCFDVVNMLRAKTGWTYTKIYRTNTFK